MTTPETPREDLNESAKNLADLKAEVSRNANPNTDELEEMGDLRKKIEGKKPSSSEIAVLEKNNLVKEGKVYLADLVKKHFEMNSSVSTSQEWKELQKKPEYVATIQATMNIMNKQCKITGEYNEETKIALREFVKERTGKSTVLDSDGYLSAIHKDVLVNALIHPKNIERAKTKDYTDYSSLEPDLRDWLKNTYWNVTEGDDNFGKIRVPNKRYLMPGTKGNFPYRYPARTNFNIED